MMKVELEPFRRRAKYIAAPAVALILAACNSSHSEAPQPSASSSVSGVEPTGSQWEQVQPEEREIACSSGEEHTEPGETRFAFTVPDENGAPQVIGRLAVRLDPSRSNPEALNGTWSFPPDQERRYGYGIENLPNIRTESGVYELSLSDEARGEPPEYEVHCSQRSESWPPPYTEPTF